MGESQGETVPRPQESPTLEEVLALMAVGEPYTTGDLADQFEASRWTIERRLEDLHDAGEIQRKKHAANRVSWWREGD